MTSFENIADGLGLESAAHDAMAASCYNEHNECICPAIESVQYTKFVATRKPLEVAAFFVPSSADNGIALVAFICSPVLADIDGRHFSLQINDGERRPVDYFALLGKGPDLQGISYNYAVAKFFFAKEELAAFEGQHFNILFKERALTKNAQGIVPTLPHGDFTFIAVGDIQKQTQRYLLDDHNSGSTLYPLADLLASNGQQASMQLVVGDFVRNGVNLSSWNEVLSKLSSMSIHDRPAIVGSAIGSHDFANVDWGILRFFKSMPTTFGHLFNFARADQELRELAPQEQVNKTAGWFDMGRVDLFICPIQPKKKHLEKIL